MRVRYEDGKLIPAQPLPYRSGEVVRIFILPRTDPVRWDLARLASCQSEDQDLAQAGLDEWATALETEDQG
jgi:predicted DNA-binding antitoxin AbrB/MazE fold protein